MSSFNAYLYASGVAEQFLPDEYNLQNHQLAVPASFVLSRMKSGATLSVYADNECLGSFAIFTEMSLSIKL